MIGTTKHAEAAEKTRELRITRIEEKSGTTKHAEYTKIGREACSAALRAAAWRNPAARSAALVCPAWA